MFQRDNQPLCQTRLHCCLLSICDVLLLSSIAKADNAPSGLISELSGKDASGWTHLQDYGFTLGGWATAGINYNTANPSDRSNGPVSMTDRNSEFNLYQLNLFLEKTVAKDKGWDVGGRFDFMFGTDTRYTQATGHWDMNLISHNNRFYNIAFPQAYLESFCTRWKWLNCENWAFLHHYWL